MKLKAVFHIDEMSKWSLLLKNVRNLLQAATDALLVEVVANAEAVKFYAMSDKNMQTEELYKLSGEGVRFVACNNALHAFEIDRAQLFAFVQIVPAGVLELIERQTEGYAYIKP